MKITVFLFILITVFHSPLKAETKTCDAENYQLYSWVDLTDLDTMEKYAKKNELTFISVRENYLAFVIEGKKKNDIASASLSNSKIDQPFIISDKEIRLNVTGLNFALYEGQSFKVKIQNKRGLNCEMVLDLTRH